MLRRIASTLHLYLGLAAFLVLIPIGFTGSVLVFSDEIDEWLMPELVRVEPAGSRVSIEAAVRAIRAAYPDEPIERLELPREREDPFEAILQSERTVYVHPYEGHVLGAHLPHETLTGFLFELHVHLLAGELGKQVVGITGLLLLILGISGLILWWRGLGQVRRGFTVKWNSGSQRLNYDLHNVAGIISVIPLLVVAFTGAGLIFYGAFDQAAHRLSGTPLPGPPPSSNCCPNDPPPELDALVDRAQAHFPKARPARIEFPAGPEAPFRLRLKHPDELHPIGLTMAYFDRYTGQMLQSSSAVEVPVARQFGYGFYPLHIGSFGGLGVRLLYVFIGLAPVGLGITGGLIWLWRRRKRAAPSETPPRPTRSVPASLPSSSTAP